MYEEVESVGVKDLLERYEMLGLVMRNRCRRRHKDLSIRSAKAGEVTPRMTWSVLNHVFIPSIVSHDSLFDKTRTKAQAVCTAMTSTTWLRRAVQSSIEHEFARQNAESRW